MAYSSLYNLQFSASCRYFVNTDLIIILFFDLLSEVMMANFLESGREVFLSRWPIPAPIKLY